MVSNGKLLCTGVGGSLIAAICCFTPVLVITLAGLGLSVWVGWLDYVLFPALAFFLGLTGYALYRIRRTPSPGSDDAGAREGP